MRSTLLIATLFVCLSATFGCSGGDAPTAQDKDFDKQLATASAANKSAPKSKMGFKRALPPEVAAKLGNPGPGNPPDPGK